jgi:hypothetical protein
MLPFPPAFPNRLTSNATLQGHLTAAISAVVGAAPLRASVAIVAIDDAVSPRVYRYAGVRDTEMHYSASLLKVAAMYAACQMRKSVNDFGASTPVPVPALFLAQTAAVFNPQIALAVPSLATDPEILASPLAVQADVVLTKLDTMFDISASGPPVTFKPTFFSRIKGAIVNSNNGDAAALVKTLGYKWLNGALAAGGFFTAGPPAAGVWLAGTFEMGLPNPWPVARINTLNDQGVGQATTCVDMMKMYALLDSRQLVDGPSSDEMLDLLKQAQSPGPDPSFLTRASVLAGTTISYDATHTKIGLGPLKAVNGGFDVASEGTIVKHRSTSKRFIVVYQNSRNLNASLNALSRIVDKTIRLDLGLP